MNELIAYIIAEDPPSKHVKKRTAPKQVKVSRPDGTSYLKLVYEDVHYLTANLFYSNSLHWATQQKIVDYAKDWIFPFLSELPKIEKCNLEITYFHMKDGFDLDNKVYFWTKLILDIMKTPTKKQILKAEKYKRIIKTVESLKEDTVRFVDGINMKYEKGEHRIEIKIYGRLLAVQSELF